MADSKEVISVSSKISDEIFTRFAMYDTFVRRRKWKAPALFLALMGGFALLCFTVLRGREQASLLGTVLLSVGLVLPAVWVLMYIVSVKSQTKKLGLNRYIAQYTVEFSEDGIRIVKGRESAELGWENVDVLVRDKGCSYLYTDRGRAFLLPDCAETEAAAAMAERRLPAGKIKR